MQHPFRTLAVAILITVAALHATAQPLPREVRERILEAVVEIMPYDSDAGRLVGTGGSGTIISPDGFVLTNYHVVGDDRSGQFYTWHAVFVTDPANPDRTTEHAYWARFIAGDARHDLAIVKIELLANESPLPPGTRFTAMPVGDSHTLIPGDPITVVGYPGIGGLTVTVTAGIVSGWLGEDLETGGKQWIKTDARIAGGNSGGGAFDEQGLLVAVPTARLQTNDRGFEEQNLLRPIALALPLINAHVPNALRAGGVSALAPQAAPAAPPLGGAAPAPTPIPPPAPTAAAAAAAPAATPHTTETISGSLSPFDQTLSSGEYVHLIERSLRAGVPVELTLRSVEFDVYLGVIGPDGAVVLEVDDSVGEGLDVRERFVPVLDGVHVLVVTSAFPGEVGAYRLDVTIGGTAPVDPFAGVASGDPFAAAPGADPFALTPPTLRDPFAETPDPSAAAALVAPTAPGVTAVRALDPSLGTVGTLPFGASVQGRLGGDGATAYHTYVVEVPPGAASITFHLDADADLDLFVKYGGDILDWGDGGDWLLRDITLEPFATLTVERPVPGPWFIDVVRFGPSSTPAGYRFGTR